MGVFWGTTSYPRRCRWVTRLLDAWRRGAAEENGEGAGSVEMTWAAEEFLREQLRGMPEEERPLWFPEDQIPFQNVDASKALSAGLTFRPASETASDTLAWVRSRPGGPELGAGFSADFEREVLRRWHARPG